MDIGSNMTETQFDVELLANSNITPNISTYRYFQTKSQIDSMVIVPEVLENFWTSTLSLKAKLFAI